MNDFPITKILSFYLIAIIFLWLATAPTFVYALEAKYIQATTPIETEGIFGKKLVEINIIDVGDNGYSDDDYLILKYEVVE
jgi:hypothetical protein